MAFRAEMSTEGRARFSVAGMPMEYSRRAMPLWGSRKPPSGFGPDRPGEIDRQVDGEGQGLPQASGQGSPFHAHGGEGAQPENEDWVQNNVGHTAAHHAGHGDFHASHRLEELLENQPAMTMGVKAKATVEYRVPREMTSFDEVNIRRKVGIRQCPLRSARQRVPERIPSPGWRPCRPCPALLPPGGRRSPR